MHTLLQALASVYSMILQSRFLMLLVSAPEQVNTAGGTHHAYPAAGSGFCILNDLAVTAKVRGEANFIWIEA
eukprot:202471-Pelagomonas_calceolata.AAC.1